MGSHAASLFGSIDTRSVACVWRNLLNLKSSLFPDLIPTFTTTVIFLGAFHFIMFRYSLTLKMQRQNQYYLKLTYSKRICFHATFKCYKLIFGNHVGAYQYDSLE